MCVVTRNNITRCEKGKRLFREVSEARTAYLRYIGNEVQSERLYEAYDSKRGEYERHLNESQFRNA